jgi:sugar transferase (PEP-CTERM system associated)
MSGANEKLIRRRRIVVVGSGQAAQKIAMRRRQADLRRYEVVAYLTTPGDLSVRNGVEGMPKVQNVDDLYNVEFDEVVLALDERRGAIDAEVLFDLRQKGVNVITLVEFLEREAGRVDIDVADTGWFIFTRGCHARPGYLIAKRISDIVCSLLLLVLFSPVMLLIALALSAEGRFKAPVLYRQLRVGLRGRHFELFKFRSMRTDAEEDGPKWSHKGDDRITLVGRLIRRLRLDELPQLINILRGEMSVVGPRPERPEFVDELSQRIPMYEYRHLIKPGLAGWAQLSFPYGESIDDAREKLKYDLYYIKNASFVLDLFILAQTLEIVIWGEGMSMSGRHIPFESTLPSARLPNWQPRSADVSERYSA